MFVSCREHTEKDDLSVTCCLYHVLSNEPDFKSQKSWLSETVEKHPGCQRLFFPKFHCELNFIEMVWAWAKAHHRSTCTYQYYNLKTGQRKAGSRTVTREPMLWLSVAGSTQRKMTFQ